MPRSAERCNIIKTVFCVDVDELGTSGFPELSVCVRHIRDDILSLKILRNRKTKNRLETYINSGFNYTLAVEILNKSGDMINYNSLKSVICRCNLLLRDKYGDVCKILKTPTPNSVKNLARVILMQDDNKILIDELENLSDVSFNLRYDLNDCKKEILLLMLLSSYNVSKLINQVDGKKLRYLTTLLQQTTKNVNDAWVLKQYLQPEVIDKTLPGCSFDDFLK